MSVSELEKFIEVTKIALPLMVTKAATDQIETILILAQAIQSDLDSINKKIEYLDQKGILKGLEEK